MNEIQNGSKVQIRVGAVVTSMNPSRRSVVNKKARTITVHRVDNGRSIGFFHVADYEYRNVLNDEQRAKYDRLKELFKFQDKAVREDAYKEAQETFFEVSPPKVVWPGTGGYWCWVNLSDVEPI